MKITVFPFGIEGARLFRRTSELRRTCDVLAALVCVGAQVFGQATMGTISGVVTDLTGAVMPGVTVTATNQPGGASQTATTDDSGRYRLADLPAGTYELSFARESFETASQTLRLGTALAVLDVTLAVRAVSTTIIVREAGGTVADIGGKTTASRMDVPNQDLPVQVSSIPQQVLQLQGANDMVTALRNVSGVSAFRAYGMYEYQTVRGFNGGGITSIDARLVDGMRLEGNRLATQLTGIEQIDVLKGPNSILYGPNALGGAINIIRKRPEAMPSYELLYRGGRFNTHQVGGGATGPIFGNDSLLYRADVSYEHSDGWRDAGARRLHVGPALTWLINDRSRVTVRETITRDDFDGDAGVPVGVLGLAGFDLSTSFNTPQDFSHLRDSRTQVFFNVSLTGNLEFRNNFFYLWSNDQYFTAESLFHRPALNQVDRQFLYFQHHRRPLLNQADLTGTFDLLGMRHRFLIGYEYEDFYNYTDRSATRSVFTTPINLSTFRETHVPFPDFPRSRVDNFSNRINAFFWQDQIAVTERLKINVGGRLDDFRRGAHNDPYDNDVLQSRASDQRRHQTPYTYRAGAVYGLTGGQEVYFGAASSFRPVTVVPGDGRELKSETGYSYEVGHRWRAMNGRFEVSTALYRIVLENVVIGRGNQIFDQAGQQSSKGIDLDINGDLGYGIRMIANYGFTVPRYDEFFANNGALDLTGKRPRFTQRHAANVWLTKSWRSGFNASAGMRYLSSIFNDDPNTVRLGGFTVFSGAVGYRGSYYEWSLNAENLFNRERYFHPAQIASQVYPGQPINVFSTIRFRFR